MPDTPAAVDHYLAELPEDRRHAIEVVRQVILENLDRDYEEGMQYGAIGYYVPHRVHPAGYHCNPKEPLPFANLASKKNYMTLHLMCIYGDPNLSRWFQEAWAKTGKKLDMGKACVRFKKAEDLALDVIAEAIRRVPAMTYIAVCEAALSRTSPTCAKEPVASQDARKLQPRRPAERFRERKSETTNPGRKL